MIILFFYSVPGLTYVQAADAFELSPKAIANAKDDESESKEFSRLSLPPIERDRMHLQRPFLDTYFASIEPVSGMLFAFTIIRHILKFPGRTNPTFRGTARGCFQAYQRYCRKEKAESTEIIHTPSIFHRERLAANVGILAAYDYIM